MMIHFMSCQRITDVSPKGVSMIRVSLAHARDVIAHHTAVGPERAKMLQLFNTIVQPTNTCYDATRFAAAVDRVSVEEGCAQLLAKV
jgi:hypothetical protein